MVAGIIDRTCPSVTYFDDIFKYFCDTSSGLECRSSLSSNLSKRKSADSFYKFVMKIIVMKIIVVNPLTANFTKWSNTFKPTNCLSVFDHFMGLALKRLRK